MTGIRRKTARFLLQYRRWSEERIAAEMGLAVVTVKNYCVGLHRSQSEVLEANGFRRQALPVDEYMKRNGA